MPFTNSTVIDLYPRFVVPCIHWKFSWRDVSLGFTGVKNTLAICVGSVQNRWKFADTTTPCWKQKMYFQRDAERVTVATVSPPIAIGWSGFICPIESQNRIQFSMWHPNSPFPRPFAITPISAQSPMNASTKKTRDISTLPGLKTAMWLHCRIQITTSTSSLPITFWSTFPTSEVLWQSYVECSNHQALQFSWFRWAHPTQPMMGVITSMKKSMSNPIKKRVFPVSDNTTTFDCLVQT